MMVAILGKRILYVVQGISNVKFKKVLHAFLKNN